MFYKSSITSALLVLLTACSRSTNITATSSDGKTLVVIRPSTGSVNLYISCDLKTKEPKITLKGPMVFDNKPRFIWDQKETHYETIFANTLSSYNPNDSREILRDLNSTSNLKVKSSYDVSEFNIQSIKPSIKTHLERCM